MKFILLILLGLSSVEAFMDKKFVIADAITDFSVGKNSIYVATNKGKVIWVDKSTLEQIKLLTLPRINTPFSGSVEPKVLSIDSLEDNLLMVVQAPKGFKSLYLFTKMKIQKLVDVKDKRTFVQADFITKDNFFLVDLASYVSSYNLKEGYFTFDKPTSGSTFSSFVLNQKRTMAILSDESGALTQVDVTSGEVIKVYEGENVDKVYQSAWKKNILIAGGLDRRVALYDTRSTEHSHTQETFMVHSIALSDDATMMAYSANEQSDIKVMNIETKKTLTWLKGHKAPITKIIFLDSKHLLSSGEDGQLIQWSL